MDLVFYSALTVLGLVLFSFSIRQIVLTFTSESKLKMASVLSKRSGVFISHGAVIDGHKVKSDKRLADN